MNRNPKNRSGIASKSLIFILTAIVAVTLTVATAIAYLNPEIFIPSEFGNFRIGFWKIEQSTAGQKATLVDSEGQVGFPGDFLEHGNGNFKQELPFDFEEIDQVEIFANYADVEIKIGSKDKAYMEIIADEKTEYHYLKFRNTFRIVQETGRNKEILHGDPLQNVDTRIVFTLPEAYRGRLYTNAYAGNTVIEGVRLEQIEAELSCGNIDFSGSATDVALQTGTGNITLKISEMLPGNLTLNSEVGIIRVSVPHSEDLFVSASTELGAVDLFHGKGEEVGTSGYGKSERIFRSGNEQTTFQITGKTGSVILELSR